MDARSSKEVVTKKTGHTSHEAERTGRIAALLAHAPNRRLLRDQLHEHEVWEPDGGPAVPDVEVDLIIVDRPTLHRLQSDLAEYRRERQPVLVPVLLVVPEHDLDRIPLRQELVEDVLVAPVRKAELAARVGTLLRLSAQSRREHEARRRTEDWLAGATRAFRALSACNEAVIRSYRESDLLERVCEALVDTGDYVLAWVGYARNDQARRIVPVACSELGRGHGSRIHITWADEPEGRGPAGRAVRSGRSALSPNIPADPSMEPWRRTLEAYGFASSVALPIRVHQHVAGILAIYAGSRGAFDASELQLLERAAANLAHGVQALRDHSERAKSERWASYLAYRDTLTSLPNRKWLSEALEQLDAEPTPEAALLFLDLDGFKVVNDALGHAAGDDLLQQVAQRLRSLLRDDDLVARQGGDEFIVLMPYDARDEVGPDSDEEVGDRIAMAASRVADRIIRALCSPFDIRGSEHYISGSIGISLFPRDTSYGPALLSQADAAMYQAKDAGGGAHRFYSRTASMYQRRRLELESGLHQALKEGAFELHYHPIVDLLEQRPHELEALIRWPRRDGSYISPGEFIPVAEQSGLIVAIGDWVVQEAVRALERLVTAGRDVTLAINLSVLQFRQPEFVERLREIVDASTVEPSRIRLEITESAMMEEIAALEGTLQQLAHHGFGLAIDDFGTGHSSLRRLRDLPIGTLKIDKSFLDDTPHHERAVTMISTILSLAHDLGLSVVGEGVETAAQLRMLRELRCDHAQGFYFSRPGPLEDVVPVLDRSPPSLTANSLAHVGATTCGVGSSDELPTKSPDDRDLHSEG